MNKDVHLLLVWNDDVEDKIEWIFADIKIKEKL